LYWWRACVIKKVMNAYATPFGLPDTAPEVARRFAVIMAGLGALIARRFLKMPHLTGFTLLLWGRLNRAVQRLHRALARPVGKVRAPRVPVDRDDDEMRVRPVSLPAGRGWIVRELGWEAAAYKGHLEILLADPAMLAALAATPGAARILRPICRMLGVAMPVVEPPILAEADAPEDVVAARAPFGRLDVYAAGSPSAAGKDMAPANGR
jgi:hypothetical protein